MMRSQARNPRKLAVFRALIFSVTALLATPGVGPAQQSDPSSPYQQPAPPPAYQQPGQYPAYPQQGQYPPQQAPYPPPYQQQSPYPPPGQPAQGPPPQSVTEECNRYAASQVGNRDKTTEVAKDTIIGGLGGAALGAGIGAIAGGGRGAGRGAAIGGGVGVVGGALYGINENNKNDEAYRAAYASCMRARGYN